MTHNPDPLAMIAGMRREIEDVLRGNQQNREALESMLNPPLLKSKKYRTLKRLSPRIIRKAK